MPSEISILKSPYRSTCDELMLLLRGPWLPAMMTWASRLVAFFVNSRPSGYIAGTRLHFFIILLVAEMIAVVSAQEIGFEAW